MDITAASKMLPVTSRGRYGWARPAALNSGAVLVAAVFCVELGLSGPDVESCSWML